MHSTIQSLLVLQDRDLRIIQLKKDKERIPLEKEASESRLDVDNKALEKVETEAKEVELEIRGLETDIATRRDTISKLTTQQFETKKNDEYTALGNEIIRYNKEVSDLEDKELDLMEKAEELTTENQKATEALDRTKSLVAEEIKKLDERFGVANERIVELTKEREALAEPIDEDPLEDYDRILESKQDAVVVALEHGVCSGCHMKVTPGTLSATKMSEIATCDNCGRFVYHPVDGKNAW